MPKENDRQRLDLLARVLLGAIGDVQFERRAFIGSQEPDDLGLNVICGPEVPPMPGRARILREALAESLRHGECPNRVDIAGDERGDPETRYEFRLRLNETNAYVKAVLDLDDPNEPLLIVKKVGRQN